MHLQDKISLETAALKSPIERGHAKTGWLTFRIPVKVEMQGDFSASIDFVDYLGHQYQILFSWGKPIRRVP
jgi:hypothetical protein